VSVFQLSNEKQNTKNKGNGGKNENDDVERELIFKEDGRSHTQVGRKDYVTFVVSYIKRT
jgi:hypothetical protein